MPRSLSRLHFTFVALPLAAMLYAPLSVWIVRGLHHLFGVFDGGDSRLIETLVGMASKLLILLLIPAVISRLRNAGLSSWLVLPMIVFPLADAFNSWEAFIDFDRPFPSQPLLLSMGAVSGLYGAGLVLLLLFFPSREKAPTVSAASTF